MKEEIQAALQFLVSFIQRSSSMKDETIEQFRQELEKTLNERYVGHWYTGKKSWVMEKFLQWTYCTLVLDKPIKGQAYRSIEFTKENDFSDTIVNQVCRKLGINPRSLGIRQELILWIDPCEVSLRYDS